MSVLLFHIETGRQIDAPDPACLQVPDCFKRCRRVRDQVAPARLAECSDRSGPDPALDPLARHLQTHRGFRDRHPAWPVVPAAAAGSLDPVVQADALHRSGQDFLRAPGRAMRDLSGRKLATVEPATAYKGLAPLIGRRVKADVIREHWGDILRLVASLQAGTVLPSAMLKRLAAYQRQNQLDLALQELGRVERTLFMMDWLESPELRQRCQAGLNKSEQRHALAQVICTFKQGRIADRGHEAQQFRASGLNLVIAAIVYWNSTYLADAVQHLRRQGKPAPDALLAHTSPLTWEHIGFSGDFLWDRAAATADRRRPLNLGRGRMAA